MKLVAVKRIGDKRPVGTVFDEPNPRAKMLVAIGLAKPYVEPEKPVAVAAPVVDEIHVHADRSLVDAVTMPASSTTFPIAPRGRGRSSRG